MYIYIYKKKVSFMVLIVKSTTLGPSMSLLINEHLLTNAILNFKGLPL